MSIGGCSTALRKFSGPVADEIAILCRPDGGSRSVVEQAAAAYGALAAALAAPGATAADVATETLFLRDVRDVPQVLAVRTRVLAERGDDTRAPLPAFIEQPPLEGDAALVVLAAAIVPHARDGWSVRDVGAEPACPCAGCGGSGARVIEVGDQRSLFTSNLHGTGGDAYAQASAMLRAGERLLARCGFGFHDVVRSWIQLRDIDRDYDALNAARRDFFASAGIELRPASTGVGGAPFPAEHDCTLTLHAVQRPRPLDVTRMSTPLLNEAWSYGADFSRGLRVVEANRVTLHVSGTASIDEDGRTIHVGDFAAQAERMLDNVESLLARHGATRDHLMSGVTYLRHARDAATLRDLYRRRRFDAFPCAVVQADLCRPDLLCETEVVAVLPPATPTA